jgi:hypothetical protein
MNNLHKRFALFLVCISVRFSIAFLAKEANDGLLQAIGFLSLMPAIGFFYLFFSGKRKFGRETFGDKIWWNNLRPLHGTLWLLFSFYALRKNKNAWIFLLIDVFIGIFSFLVFHIKSIQKNEFLSG